MNRHLAKELRPLLLPWGIAAFAGLGHLLPTLGPGFINHDIISFLVGLSGTAFVVGVLVLTGLPMGLELQERTLTLLMSQPVDRPRLWRQKIFAATAAAIALGVVHLIARAFSSGITGDEIMVWAAFIVTAICSVGFYAMATGSIFVGVAAAAVVPWGIIAASYLIMTFVLRIEDKLTDRQNGMIAIGFFAVYSIIFLWLGRRQFCRLELRDRVQRGAQIPAILVPTRLAALNRTRPSGAIANLIRKEISLQKPMFLVSSLFVIIWIAVVALMLVRPTYQKAWEDGLDSITGIQVILMAFLTGCVALGDDKSLGTAAWHLTLPISYRIQWAVKLLVSFGTLIAMAVVLPGLLAFATAPIAQVGLLAAKEEAALAFAIISILLFITTFWSASISRNSIRGALAAIITLICLGICASLSAWMSTQYFATGLQAPLVAHLVARYHIPFPAFGGEGLSLDWCYGIGLAVTMVIAALIQSAMLFRRLEVKRTLIVRYFALLAGIVMLGNFWFFDFQRAWRQVSSNFEAEIGETISALPELPEKQIAGQPWELTVADLERSRALSDNVRRWLGTGKVIVNPTANWITADVCLPNRSPYTIQLYSYVQRHVRR